MPKFYYDLHVHSCLSPCGDEDMTVNNIAGMAKIKGLDIVALTDHNTVKNCPAFFKACQRYDVIPVAGAEVTTAEDIHTVCLFERLDDALDFGLQLDSFRIKIKNKPHVFGNQYILDENDEITGSEEFLLPNATSLSIEEVYNLALKYAGICFPAHADKNANGIISILGTMPDKPDFKCIELSKNADKTGFFFKNPTLKDKILLVNSDAHYLEDISEPEHCIELDTSCRDGDGVRKLLFDYLKGDS